MIGQCLPSLGFLRHFLKNPLCKNDPVLVVANINILQEENLSDQSQEIPSHHMLYNLSVTSIKVHMSKDDISLL